MEPPSPSPQQPTSPASKKGLGTGAKVGIGCGAITVLVIIAVIVMFVMYGGKLMQFAEEAQQNPTRATATMMVTASGGKMQMVAEDDVNKRYTLKETKSGNLTTVYWDGDAKKAKVVSGDFSAIPATPSTTGNEPVPEEKK